MVNNGKVCGMRLEIFVASWSFVDFISYLGGCQDFFRGSPCVECITAMALGAHQESPQNPKLSKVSLESTLAIDYNPLIKQSVKITLA